MLTKSAVATELAAIAEMSVSVVVKASAFRTGLGAKVPKDNDALPPQRAMVSVELLKENGSK